MPRRPKVLTFPAGKPTLPERRDQRQARVRKLFDDIQLLALDRPDALDKVTAYVAYLARHSRTG